MKTYLKNIIVLAVCPVISYFGTWLDNSNILTFKIPHYPYFIMILIGCLWANYKAFPKTVNPVLKYSLRIFLFVLFFIINYAAMFIAAGLYVFPKMKDF